MTEPGNTEHRSEEDILRYYERVQPHDVFGIWGTELLLRVPLSKAQRFLTQDNGWDEESWSRTMKKKDTESLVAEMEDYFQFAWEKCIAHRGVTASRTVVHYLAWSWLIADMELFAYLMEGRNYPNYGAPMILAVAQKYDLMDLLPSNPIDHEVFMNMAQGRKCGRLCNGGCGLGAPGIFRPIAPTGLLMPPTQLKVL